MKRATVGSCIVRVVSVQSSDDESNARGDDSVTPAIVMIATGTQPAALVLPPPAELGRRIMAGAQSHEVGDERMSRDHAVVTWESGEWSIRDLESRNGTFVEGERISGEVRRRGDTVLRLGHTVFLLLADGRGHPAPEGEHVVGPELARVHDQIRRVAGGDVLLLHGEPGTGQELAARVFHESGPRRAGPFVAVNCASMPTGVAERLLFGARKGASSGALSGAIAAIGHLQMANGGTLFLDEIASLDPTLQAKLLRVVETREVVSVGATAGETIEIGIAAATHRELRAAVAERRFGAALYERLSQATVHLPPLRERKVDLARHVQREIAAAPGGLSPHPKLIEACCLRPWPGNLRELRAGIRRAAAAAAQAGRTVVLSDDLDPAAGKPVTLTGETAVDRQLVPADIDKDAVTSALARANGVVSVAARILGVHRTQLYRLMAEHGIATDDG